MPSCSFASPGESTQILEYRGWHRSRNLKQSVVAPPGKADSLGTRNGSDHLTGLLNENTAKKISAEFQCIMPPTMNRVDLHNSGPAGLTFGSSAKM